MASGGLRRASNTAEKRDRAARRAKPWIERLARAGYVAKAVVYAVIGVLALRQAFGSGGETTGTGGAVESVGSRPFGNVLLAVLAVGLLGYAVWKFTQAIMDTEGKGSDAKGIGRRIAYAGSGLIHGGLAFTSVAGVFGSSSGGSSGGYTATLISSPFGRILLVPVGLGVLGVCAYQLHAAYEAKFRGDLRLHEMSPAAEKWATLAGRIGTAARAIVIGIVGVFVILAAYHADASETRGLGGALSAIARQPFGPFLLGAVAFGLVLYAVFMLVVAYYRRVDPEGARVARTPG